MKTLNDMVRDVNDGVDDLAMKVHALESFIDSERAEAYAQGVRAGVAAKADQLENKVVVLKVNRPDDISQRQMRDLNQIFINEFKSKLVIISEDSDLCTLHDIDLKAIGLMRIP